MADDKGISQTKLFERIFWEFTQNSNEALKGAVSY